MGNNLMSAKTTIAFSGYNIKNTALLAIDSFLKVYPFMKSQIIYFDDFSTDGTKNELKTRGIKVITWNRSLLEKYNLYVNNNPKWSNVQLLSVRVSFIIKNIIQETETDYLLLNDGDIVFISDDFLEYFFKLAKKYDIVFQKNYLNIEKHYEQRLVDTIKNKYKELIFFEDFKYITTWRMFHSHIFMNVKKLKELGITCDRHDEETVQTIKGGIFDTFSDFSFRVATCPYLKIKESNILNRNILHFGSVACEQRGFVLGISEHSNAANIHIHRDNFGQPVDRDFAIVDFNKDFIDLKNGAFKEIQHILFNGYALKEVHINPKKRIYKILFKKIAM